jgi:hypothetical protein
MAVAVGSTSALTYATRINSTITAPASIANGDLLVAVLHVGNASLTPLTVTPPTGFSAIPNDPTTGNEPDPYSIATHVYTRIAASESGSYTFTHASGESEAIMYRLTGVDATTPLDVTPVENDEDAFAGTTGSTTNYKAITPVTDGAFLIYAESDWDGPGTGTIAGTNPTIASRRVGTITWVGDGTQTTAGAIAARNRTNGNVSTGSPWASVVVAIRPSGGGGGAAAASLVWPVRSFTHMLMR